ncbi:hypothetical protein BGZ76_001935 [Entomortierella beljakovae]|nr:hypothetical protein BGZ76_001935 [Entomortierella beljakovae]
MGLSSTEQRFRSPVDGSIVTIKINADSSVLWRHILKSFGNVAKVRVNEMDIHFMTDDNLEDLSPLRIESYPNSVMEVVLSKESTGIPNQVVDLPPEYGEERKNAEKMRSVVLPFKNHINIPGDEYIRFGSRISLRHVRTGAYVHPVNWKYRTTTDTFAVLGVRSVEPGLDDFWQVVSACTDDSQDNQMIGERILYGTRIRLFNVINGRWLHTHRERSPITNQQEVTTCGSAQSSDCENYWVVTRLEDGEEFWKTTDLFLLRHESTEHYLHSHMESYMGELEVTSYKDLYNDYNDLWRARFI